MRTDCYLALRDRTFRVNRLTFSLFRLEIRNQALPEIFAATEMARATAQDLAGVVGEFVRRVWAAAGADGKG